ncbi:MAG: hypothetical protein JXA99_16130 [Candidatus Lokiarchaeota archaeon]|nr:hypothetical protein [Candidatus Lokiarchaeota archaeon]
MNQIFIKIFYIMIILLFFIELIIPIKIIKRSGKDPRGQHKDYSILAKLCLFTSLMWVIYILLYIIIEDIVLNFSIIGFLANDFFIIFGMLTIILSYLFQILGIIKLGLNFRIALPKEETKLINSGIYRFMRNPIVFGIYLLFIGSFFIIPTLLSLLLVFINIITYNAKVIDEEKFLLIRFKKDFQQYKLKVGRYLPIKIKKESD